MSPGEKELARIEMQLGTVGMCLDILVEVCASLPDFTREEEEVGAEGEDEDGEEEGDDEDEEEDNEAMDEQMEAEPTASKDVPSSEESNSHPVSTAYTPASLLSLLTPPLLSLSHPTPTLSFPPPSLPSVHPPTTSALGAIHLRAMECLNNLFVGSKEREIGDEEDADKVKSAVGVWDEMWSAGLLGAVGPPSAMEGEAKGLGLASLFEPGQERRGEMWSVAVGALWGLARMSRGVLVRSSSIVLALH